MDNQRSSPPTRPGFFTRLKRWTIAIVVGIIVCYALYALFVAPRRQGLAQRGLMSLNIPIPQSHRLVNVSWQGNALWYAYCPEGPTAGSTCTFTEYTPPGVLAGKFTFTHAR